MTKFARRFVYVLLGVIALSVAPSARAALLSDLLNGDSLVVGDKIFYNFSNFSSVGFAGASAPQADEIAVNPAVGEPFGLLFQSAKWKVDSGQSISTLLSYDVAVLGNALITAVSGQISAFSTTPDGNIHIDNTVVTADANEDFLGSVGLSSPGSVSGTAVLSGGYSSVRVYKGISLSGENGKASLGAFRDRFIQTVVPEPTSVALMATGLLLGGVALRRRHAR